MRARRRRVPLTPLLLALLAPGRGIHASWQHHHGSHSAVPGELRPSALDVNVTLTRMGHEQQQQLPAAAGGAAEPMAAAPAPDSVEARFASIYARHIWGAEGRGSGLGSSKLATVLTVSIIRLVANTYNLRSLMDAPCGAMEWQPTLLRALEDDFPGDFKYMGVDVVPQVIAENQQLHANHTNWSFQHLDLTVDDLPKGYDLILSRDALQHLTCELAVAALQRLAGAGSHLLLLGSYDRLPHNTRIATVGEYFDINLKQPPFSLAEGVLHDFSEHTSELVAATEPDKHLLLVSGAFLRARDWAAMRAGCGLL